MGELFLFSNYINNSHSFAYLFHLILVFAIILIMAIFAVAKMKMVPRGCQNILEAYLEGIIAMGAGMLGSRELAKKYLPLVATIGLVVFFSNMIGIIPGFEAPSASLNLTVPLTLIVFFYYHFEGIKTQGFFKYFGHFCGPVKIIAPLMFVIELISHFSRIVSLSFRLFGNIKGDDLFLMVILALAPYVAPLPAFGLLTLMGCLQAFVFMMLTYVYLAGAVVVSEEH